MPLRKHQEDHEETRNPTLAAHQGRQGTSASASGERLLSDHIARAVCLPEGTSASASGERLLA
ncbi:MAG: hypothetical protein M1420_00775 [Actinobacteria bacterium]|nr:hypothetical protein [Actinomycetota bacterium]